MRAPGILIVAAGSIPTSCPCGWRRMTTESPTSLERTSKPPTWRRTRSTPAGQACSPSKPPTSLQRRRSWERSLPSVSIKRCAEEAPAGDHEPVQAALERLAAQRHRGATWNCDTPCSRIPMMAMARKRCCGWPTAGSCAARRIHRSAPLLCARVACKRGRAGRVTRAVQLPCLAALIESRQAAGLRLCAGAGAA